jgi:hypothetical protein
MGYWLKSFSDNTCEKGTDQEVAVRLKSWSRGRLDNIISVRLHHIGLDLEIHGLGEYWQSDTYESIFSSTNSTVVQRRIERKVVPPDSDFRVFSNNSKLSVFFNPNPLAIGKYFSISPDLYDKWLVAEMDLKTMKVKCYFSDGRV